MQHEIQVYVHCTVHLISDWKYVVILCVYWLSKSYVNKKAYFSVEYKHQEVYNNNGPRKIAQTYDLSKVNDVRGSIFIYLTMGGREGRRHNWVESQNLYAIAFHYVKICSWFKATSSCKQFHLPGTIVPFCITKGQLISEFLLVSIPSKNRQIICTELTLENDKATSEQPLAHQLELFQ